MSGENSYFSRFFVKFIEVGAAGVPQLRAVAPARRPDDRLEQVGGHVGSRAGAAEHIAFGQQLIVGRHRRRPRSATSSRVCASPVESACCTLSTYSVTT